jgi:transcriptional regulator with XRE-family HTH domain
MPKKEAPGALAHVVIFLRARTGMTQTEFGRASRVNQADVSRYELGRIAPSEAVLRRMADVAGIGWPLVVSLRRFLGSFLAAAERWDQAPDGPAPDLAVPEPARLAAAPFLFEAARIGPASRSAEEERREAAEIWGRLERFPVSWRRRLIELSPRSGSWALALQASKGSLRQAAQRPEEALELAELALSIAERVPGEESWRSRLLGFCWAHVANARRVANDPAGAAEAFVRARDLWRAGADSEGRLSAERMYDLPASWVGLPEEGQDPAAALP